MKTLKLVSLTLGLFAGGCQYEESLPDASAPICTDIVIWHSPASDCTDAGGTYGPREWPIGSGVTEDTCSFCPETCN